MSISNNIVLTPKTLLAHMAYMQLHLNVANNFIGDDMLLLSIVL